MKFAKGHGTGNDFVIVPDPDGDLTLPPDVVAALCDRRRGLGGDGLLRVVRTAAVRSTADGAALGARVTPNGLGVPEWFMDYRNADGSLAEMCGNGVRVYARYLVHAGLAAGPSVPILTRAGRVVAHVGGAAGDVVSVDMPTPEVAGSASARLDGTDYPGTVATCGNPNLVCRVADDAALDAGTLDLSRPLWVDPVAFPAGANVEFVGPVRWVAGMRRVRMRVVERGVGETLSCGSGACAAAAVVLHEDSGEGTVIVDVPGGRLTVSINGERCVLAGPAVIVATGTVTMDSLTRPPVDA